MTLNDFDKIFTWGKSDLEFPSMKVREYEGRQNNNFRCIRYSSEKWILIIYVPVRRKQRYAGLKKDYLPARCSSGTALKFIRKMLNALDKRHKIILNAPIEWPNATNRGRRNWLPVDSKPDVGFRDGIKSTPETRLQNSATVNLLNMSWFPLQYHTHAGERLLEGQLILNSPRTKEIIYSLFLMKATDFESKH